MHGRQLERLKKDSKELGHYIHKLNKKGRIDTAYKMQIKKDFLNQQILELETQE